MGGSSDPVAFCAYHKMTLSKQQMKSKECLQKECPRLIKYDHPYWVQREQEKVKKQQRKEEKKMRERQEKEQELRNEIMHRVTYCHNAPDKYTKQLAYCSDCKYSEGCMSEIIELVYDYFTRF